MKYVIIGNGVAGTTAASAIRKIDSTGRIIILTEEGYPFYSRIKLINYLAREATLDDIIIYKDEWYRNLSIELRLSTKVIEINSKEKFIKTDRGEIIEYERLLIATGGYSFTPPINGSNLNGVFTLRSVSDADRILEYAKAHKDVVLIGGGVLGLEAGNSLRKIGCNITVIEFFPRLLPRQMDPDGAGILQAQLEDMGCKFYLGATTEEICGTNGPEKIILKDGTEIDCDMVIISAGIRPRAELLTESGIKINKGVLVNNRMETKIPDIYAAGDLIEHEGRFYGIWPAAQEQGEVAGVNMAGGDAQYSGTVMSNTLKVVGIDLATAGDIDAEGDCESVVFKDRQNYIYRKLVFRDNLITGCIMYGDISHYRKVLKAINEKKDISGIRDTLYKWDMSGL